MYSKGWRNSSCKLKNILFGRERVDVTLVKSYNGTARDGGILVASYNY